MAAEALSSITWKPGETPASSGNRRSSFSQKAWMVWIFNPPGVSSALANRPRASDSCLWLKPAGSRPSNDPSCSRSLTSGVTHHSPSRSKSRRCISAAATLV